MRAPDERLSRGAALYRDCWRSQHRRGRPPSELANRIVQVQGVLVHSVTTRTGAPAPTAPSIQTLAGADVVSARITPAIAAKLVGSDGVALWYSVCAPRTSTPTA